MDNQSMYEQAGVASCPKCDGPLFWTSLMKFFLFIPALGCSLCGTYIHQLRVDVVGGRGRNKKKGTPRGVSKCLENLS